MTTQRDRRIAVLLASHERVHTTLQCLAALSAQVGHGGVLQVTLVDAASTDGTADAVEARHPDVTVLRRGAELFWNGGMRAAWEHAWTQNPDFYLWLNDDVVLDADAVARMVSTYDLLYAEGHGPCIVVGSMRDPVSDQVTYGGVVRPARLRPLHFAVVQPGGAPRRAATMNGNGVLVPREVVSTIGTLARAYTHAMGDYDYGLRAGRAGFEVWITAGTIGTCARNPAFPRARTLREHGQRAISPTTGLPWKEWATFARRWAGPLWLLFALSPYLRGLLAWVRDRPARRKR